MGAIADLIKDIPLSAVLREKVLGLESKLAAAETQIDLLEIELNKANAQVDQLRDKNEHLVRKINYMRSEDPPLHEVADKILRLFGQYSDKEISKEWMIYTIGGDPNTITYYFADLEDNSYIEAGAFSQDEEEIPYRLKQKGRKYLIDHPA